MVADVARNGLKTPITLKRASKGRYNIVDGLIRYEACKRLGRGTIPAYVKD